MCFDTLSLMWLCFLDVGENPDCQTCFLMCPDPDIDSDTPHVPELQFNSETESNTYTVCKKFGDDDDDDDKQGLQKKYKPLLSKN